MATKRGEKKMMAAVRIDDDERECLRKLADSTLPLPHQSIMPTNSKPTKKSQREAKQKLETKKSEDINESAENFIQKFRQELLLQRLESLENYDRMLARGL